MPYLVPITSNNMTLEISHETDKSRSLQTYSIEDQIVNILPFMGHVVSVSITKLCHYSMKTASYNT